MQDKHKVTLYLPPELHRQLKIRSAVELEPMSILAERAIVFYLEHSDVVDEVEETHGQVHRIYECPSCSTSLILQEGELVHLQRDGAILSSDDSSVPSGTAESSSKLGQQGEEELVHC